MSVLTNICIFCSRDCDREELCESELQKTQTKTLQQFVKLVERYLETSFLPQTRNGNVEERVLETCPDCLIVVESFCILYHKWKCLEMELEWRLRQLSDAMNSLDERKFDSRSNAQCNNEDRVFGEVLKNFRTDFQQKCTHNFSKSFPRVSLNRWKGLPSKQEACYLNSEADPDFNQLFLGWVSTLAVVFQLGLGNLLQKSNEIARGGDQHHILISKGGGDDDDEHFEHVQNRQNLSSCSGAREIGFFASSDNQFVPQNTPEVELERSEFKRLSSKPKVKLPLKVKTRKPMGLHKCSFTASDKQRHDIRTKAPFKCFCCSKNFGSFFQLKCHQRAFTHVLMKRKFIDKQAHHKRLKRTKRQSKNSNKIETCSSVANEHVGVLRALRKTTKRNSAMADSDRISKNDEQDSLAKAADDDDWNLSCSDDADTSTNSSGSFSSRSSSGSISSDEHLDTPSSPTPKRRVPAERHAYFLKRKQLQSHKKEIHSGQHVANSDASLEPSDKEQSQPVPGKCGSFFARPSTFEKHKKNFKKKEINTKVCKTKFHCEVGSCKHSFNFKGELDIHQKHHGLFSCQFCKVVKTFAPNLAIHELTHAKEKCKSDKTHFYCARCDYKVSNRKRGNMAIVNHYLKQHFGLPLQRVMCSICKATTFKSEEDLENHRKLHGKFSCSFCPVVENYAPNLAVHESTHVESALARAAKGARQGQPYSCSRCTFTICGKFRYVEHFLETHLKLPSDGVTCSNCGEKCSYKDLSRHLKSHHDVSGIREEEVARCDKCPAFFMKQIQLVSHKKKRHGEDYLTCVDCGKKYVNPYVLQTHRTVVHKKKEADFPLACDVPSCERRFERKAELEWHKHNVHAGKKKDNSRVCDKCGKKCSTEIAFITHIKVHGEKKATLKKRVEPRRFVCEECGKAFNSRQTLEVHQMTHTGPASWKWGCLFCGKKCLTQYGLQGHLRAHTKEKPYICGTCGAEYALGRDLRNHRNKKHNANEQPQPRRVVNGRVSKKGQKLPPRLSK